MKYSTLSLFCVSVPVLSEAMSVHAPRPSMAASLRTMTLRLDMAREAEVRATVMATGKPSGMVETAKATEKRKSA